MPHRLPPPQRVRRPREQGSLNRLRAQEQDAEVEQEEAALIASGERQLQQRKSPTQSQGRQDPEVRMPAVAVERSVAQHVSLWLRCVALLLTFCHLLQLRGATAAAGGGSVLQPGERQRGSSDQTQPLES